MWSAQTVTDVSSMYQRLDEISDWLDAYGLTHNLNYDFMLRRMAGSENISALRTLADVVEPVKGYSRSNLAKSEPTALVPLNRMIDVAQPESAAGGRLSVLVDSFVSGQIKPGVEPQIRAMPTKSRDNQNNLRPLPDKSSFLHEEIPLSQNLSALGTA